MIVETKTLWPNRSDVTLTAYVMEANPFFMPEKPPPAVIICPGGAYQNLARDTEGDIVATRFLAAGYQAFVLAYTVAESAGENDTRFPAPLLDLGKAMLTLRENAERWNLDPDRISVMGFSAGAHLCATLATKWHLPLLPQTLGGEAAWYRPAAAVLLYGLFDYAKQKEYQDKHGRHPALPAGGNEYASTFGSSDPSAEQLREYSPSECVSENTAPCFLACATDDGMVPAFHSMQMASALYEKGIAFELHVFEKGAHGFGLGQTLTARNRRDKDWNCAEWVALAQRFMMSHTEPETAEGDFWPPLPEDMKP